MSKTSKILEIQILADETDDILAVKFLDFEMSTCSMSHARHKLQVLSERIFSLRSVTVKLLIYSIT